MNDVSSASARKFSAHAPKRRGAPEASLQVKIVNFMRAHFRAPPDGPYWTAVNPVPAKSLSVALLSKQMGMRAGIADLLLLWRGLGVAIELKADKGRRSPPQIMFAREWTAAGGKVFEVRSVDEFKMLCDVLAIPLRGV